MYLNPFSEEFFGYKIINGIIEGFTIFFVGDGTEESKGILGFLKSIFEGIGNLVDFVLNFFTNLLDFFIHIFVPTDEQWEEIKDSYNDLMITIEGHIPFVSFIKSTFSNMQNTVINPHDFLLIEMPSFSFFGGQTEKVQYVNVRDAYEPYRIEIRSWLTLVVYGLAFVYIVKHILNYGSTHSDNASIKEVGKKGD